MAVDVVRGDGGATNLDLDFKGAVQATEGRAERDNVDTLREGGLAAYPRCEPALVAKPSATAREEGGAVGQGGQDVPTMSTRSG